jgi:hypothetical protein
MSCKKILKQGPCTALLNSILIPLCLNYTSSFIPLLQMRNIRLFKEITAINQLKRTLIKTGPAVVIKVYSAVCITAHQEEYRQALL